MKKLLLIGIIILILLGSLYVFTIQKASTTPQTGTATNEYIPPVDNSDLKAGGSSYLNAQGVYTILYPADYTLDTQDKQHIRIYKIGPTQKGQTEMYDGVIIVFETVNLQGKTLQEWVDTRIQQSTADGTSEVIEPTKNIILNGYSGVRYAMRGLGESTNYVLQKNLQSPYAVVITTAVYDPKEVGFQAEVDKTLSTIELLK